MGFLTFVGDKVGVVGEEEEEEKFREMGIIFWAVERNFHRRKVGNAR